MTLPMAQGTMFSGRKASLCLASTQGYPGGIYDALFTIVGASQIGPTSLREYRLTVSLMWPHGHLVGLRALSSLRIIETSLMYFGKTA